MSVDVDLVADESEEPLLDDVSDDAGVELDDLPEPERLSVL